MGKDLRLKTFQNVILIGVPLKLLQLNVHCCVKGTYLKS